MKKIYYWSPCLDLVGTVNSTINSAIALKRYSKENYNIKIINCCGEWDNKKELLIKENIELKNFYFKYFNFLPKKGFIQSRFSSLVIIILSFVPLLRLLKKEKPDFIIIHLITSLPLILLNMFSFKTKFILRISGFPKLNFLRSFLWKTTSQKIFKVTSPSIDLISQLKKKKIFLENNLFFLPDAAINVDNIEKQKLDKKINLEKNFFLAIGRLTKQKNFQYLVNEFSDFLKSRPNQKLLIFGEGEEKDNLQKKIKDYNLTNQIFLKGNSDSVFIYMKNARAFVLSSLWEEPGIVMIESAYNNCFIISSDCKNGPSEFLDNEKGGLLFKNNSKGALYEKILEFENMNETEKKKKIIFSKKKSKMYSLVSHYKVLNSILN